MEKTAAWLNDIDPWNLSRLWLIPTLGEDQILQRKGITKLLTSLLTLKTLAKREADLRPLEFGSTRLTTSQNPNQPFTTISEMLTRSLIFTN